MGYFYKSTKKSWHRSAPPPLLAMPRFSRPLFWTPLPKEDKIIVGAPVKVVGGKTVVLMQVFFYQAKLMQVWKPDVSISHLLRGHQHQQQFGQYMPPIRKDAICPFKGSHQCKKVTKLRIFSVRGGGSTPFHSFWGCFP